MLVERHIHPCSADGFCVSIIVVAEQLDGVLAATNAFLNGTLGVGLIQKFINGRLFVFCGHVFLWLHVNQSPPTARR